MNLNKQIHRQVLSLRVEYALYLLLSALLAGAYETDFLAEGAWVGQVGKTYVGESVGVMLMIVLVPLSLKLFPLCLPRYAAASADKRLHAHRWLSRLRLVLLAVPTYLNLWIYYATLDNMGGLCALICITASLFCLPGVQRLKDELVLTDSNEA